MKIPPVIAAPSQPGIFCIPRLSCSGAFAMRRLIGGSAAANREADRLLNSRVTWRMEGQKMPGRVTAAKLLT
jgi:hypothetical protein